MRYKLTVIIPTYNQPELIKIGLDSIPAHLPIQTLVVNDGSTDATPDIVRKYMHEHPDKNITLLSYSTNKGVSYAVNMGLDRAEGEYIVLLASDGDYFLPGILEKALNEWLDGTDLIFYDIIDNTKHIRRLRPGREMHYPGSVKFMRREFVDNIRCPLERRRAEDVVFTDGLLAKNPTKKFTNTIAKHYNYPRVGSLTWNARHGVTDRIGNPLNGNKRP